MIVHEKEDLLPNSTQGLLEGLQRQLTLEEIARSTGLHPRTLYRVRRGLGVSGKTNLSLLNVYLKKGALT